MPINCGLEPATVQFIVVRLPTKPWNCSETVLSLCSDNNTLWIGYQWGGADHVNENGIIIDHYDQKQPEITFRITGSGKL